jgi:hypothetical protein
MKQRFPYQLAMGLTPVVPSSGPLEGEALEAHLSDVERRTQLAVADAMEKHIHGDGVRKVEQWSDGYDPFGW